MFSSQSSCSVNAIVETMHMNGKSKGAEAPTIIEVHEEKGSLNSTHCISTKLYMETVYAECPRKKDLMSYMHKHMSIMYTCLCRITTLPVAVRVAAA